SKVNDIGAGFPQCGSPREQSLIGKRRSVDDLPKDAYGKTREIGSLPAVAKKSRQVAELIWATRDRHAEVFRQTGKIGAAAAGQDNPVGANRFLEAAHDDRLGHQGRDLDADIADLPGKQRLAQTLHQPLEAPVSEMTGEKEETLAHSWIP